MGIFIYSAIAMALSTMDKLIRFFFITPAKKNTRVLLRPFQQCVKERGGFFHHYREDCNGEWQLDNFYKLSSVKKVGDGIYMKTYGGFIQLPLKQNFRDVDDFMVHCSLTLIREGQYISPWL